MGQRAAGRGLRLAGVSAAEQNDVSQQGVELVEPDTSPPTLAQRADSLIALEDLAEVRASEQCQHGEVRLAVTALRRGVDEDDSPGRPHDVSAPQVAMQAGRTFVGVEISRHATVHHALDECIHFPAQVTAGPLRHRSKSLVSIERAPRTVPVERSEERRVGKEC